MHRLPAPMNRRILDVDEWMESEPDPSIQASDPKKKSANMAGLHALLTKRPSVNVKRAKARSLALAQERYYQEARHFFSLQHDDNGIAFPFFALPAELRLAVYFELLVTNDRLLVTWRGPRKAIKQQKQMYIDVLLTCKHCCDEGTSVLYAENVFDFEEICNRPISVAKPFVKTIGLHNASKIRIVITEYSAAAEELSYIRQTVAEEGLQTLEEVEAGSAGDNLPTKYSLTDAQRHLDLALAQHKLELAVTPRLTLPSLHTTLAAFNISLPSLRVLAISILPYGSDQATIDLMQTQTVGVMNDVALRLRWLDSKNEPSRLQGVIRAVCDREVALVQAEWWQDVDAWIGFRWDPPFGGRHWIAYSGVRGKGTKSFT